MTWPFFHSNATVLLDRRFWADIDPLDPTNWQVHHYPPWMDGWDGALFSGAKMLVLRRVMTPTNLRNWGSERVHLAPSKNFQWMKRSPLGWLPTTKPHPTKDLWKCPERRSSEHLSSCRTIPALSFLCFRLLFGVFPWFSGIYLPNKTETTSVVTCIHYTQKLRIPQKKWHGTWKWGFPKEISSSWDPFSGSMLVSGRATYLILRFV